MISGNVSGKTLHAEPRETLWLEVTPPTFDQTFDQLKRDVERWDEGEVESHISVAMSAERLRAFLSSERFRLVNLIRRSKPGSVYELAKLAGRPRMAVVQDLKLLRALGFVKFRASRGPGRKKMAPYVPYKAIRIAIDL
jgi:predicted transcriptional regulator